MAERRVRLTFDNVADYFDDGEVRRLLVGVTVDPGQGIPPDSPVVRRFLEWLRARNAESEEEVEYVCQEEDVEFVCSPYEAALILEHVGGHRND